MKPSRRIGRLIRVLDSTILLCLCAGCLGLASVVVWALYVL